MKRNTVIIIVIVILLGIGLFLYSTEGKMADIFLNDFTLSEDGKQMTISIGVASSVGYVRTVKEKKEDNKAYLTFYSTYGFNSTLGANSKFQIELDPSITEIYFYRGDSGYELILQKNQKNTEWEKVR